MFLFLRKSIICVSSCLSVLLLWTGVLAAQNKAINYIVLSKGDTIGRVQMRQEGTAPDLHLSSRSEVNLKVVVNVKLNVVEEAHYQNGKLVASSVKRFVNDKLKADKRTVAEGEDYIAYNGSKSVKLFQQAIAFNILMLYYKEPAGVRWVYSDFYQKSLAIEPQASHTYKIELPEGNTNTYYYTGGLCRKVVLQSHLYTAQMLLLP